MVNDSLSGLAAWDRKLATFIKEPKYEDFKVSNYKDTEYNNVHFLILGIKFKILMSKHDYMVFDDNEAIYFKDDRLYNRKDGIMSNIKDDLDEIHRRFSKNIYNNEIRVIYGVIYSDGIHAIRGSHESDYVLTHGAWSTYESISSLLQTKSQTELAEMRDSHELMFAVNDLNVFLDEAFDKVSVKVEEPLKVKDNLELLEYISRNKRDGFMASSLAISKNDRFDKRMLIDLVDLSYKKLERSLDDIVCSVLDYGKDTIRIGTDGKELLIAPDITFTEDNLRDRLVKDKRLVEAFRMTYIIRFMI